MLLISFFSALPARAEVLTYHCEPVAFGEQLPLRIVAIRPEKVKECGALCSHEQVLRYGTPAEYAQAPIQPSWVDPEGTVVFNERLLAPEAAAAFAALHALKRYVLVEGERVRIVEVRYVDYPHLPFAFRIVCGNKGGRCLGEFLDPQTAGSGPLRVRLIDGKGTRNADTKKLVLSLAKEGLEDRRPEAREIRAELMFGGGKAARLITRVFKENVTHNTGSSVPASASAELELSLKPREFELNVGADEQLVVFPGRAPRVQRVEAAEFKFTCSAKTAPIR